jgi:hypothetical protein
MNKNKNPLITATNNAGWLGLANQGASTLANLAMSGIQHRRQKEYMGIQHKNQKDLNQQAKDLALQQWKDTNYPAQMAMLKEAGLNPGLLYGMSGGGGTTANTGSGGSASGGSPGTMPFMDVNALLQADLIKAQTLKTEAEAENISGVERELKEAEKMFTNAQTNLANANLDKIAEETRNLMLDANLKADTYNDYVKMATTNLLKLQAEKDLLNSQKNLSESEVVKIANDIEVAWQKVLNESRALNQTDRDLDRKDVEALIKKYEAEVKGNFPGLWNVIGSGLLKAGQLIERFFGIEFDQTSRVQNN